jgi:predicted DCC family thiol-disulfide oxidoreductase YuxK
MFGNVERRDSDGRRCKIIQRGMLFDDGYLPHRSHRARRRATEFVELASKPEMLFYDGHCGLCHRAVVFVLAHDRDGTAFRFAPLQGETFQRLVTPKQQRLLPDSVVVMTTDGNLLVRSEAFLHIWRRLGGAWKVLAGALSIVPRGLRDFIYNFVARIRFRVFGRREDLCPVMPQDLRARFDS